MMETLLSSQKKNCNKQGNTFYWQFYAYTPGSTLGGVRLKFSDPDSWLSNPDLIKELSGYNKKFVIVSTHKGNSIITYLYKRKEGLLKGIKDITNILMRHGYTPEPYMGLGTAFPDLEYATECLSFITETDFSIMEVINVYARTIHVSPKQIKDKSNLETDIPISSDVKFDPDKYFNPKSDLDCFEVAVQGQVSSEYEQFASMVY